MASATIRMVTLSVDAFVKNDLELAESVIISDDIVDDLFNKVKGELLELIQKNIEKFALPNIQVIAGEAPDCLKTEERSEHPTHAFIGGSSGRLKEILDVLYKKNHEMRIVINCISLETIRELTLLETDSRITDLEIIQVQVSRAKTVGGYHLMQGENPIYICSFDFTGEVS